MKRAILSGSVAIFFSWDWNRMDSAARRGQKSSRRIIRSMKTKRHNVRPGNAVLSHKVLGGLWFQPCPNRASARRQGQFSPCAFFPPDIPERQFRKPDVAKGVSGMARVTVEDCID